MNKAYEFEPNASPPYFIRMREGADATGFIDLSQSQFMFSVLIDDACFPIVGVYDPDRNGFTVDLSLLADDMQPRVSYTGYFYLDRGTGWRRVGTLKIKPVTGCIWKPVEVQ